MRPTRRSVASRVCWLLAALPCAAGLACGKKSGSADGGTPVSGSNDVMYIRESRGIDTTEPVGLRNLEALVGTERKVLTSAASISASICQIRCLLTADKSRVLFQRETGGARDIVSVPVSNFTARLSEETIVNERPLASPAMYLLPGTDRVVFVQHEGAGGTGPDGGATAPTYSVTSASVSGGSIKKYRTATFLPSSPIGVSSDGTKILFGETLGAASQLNLYVYDAQNPNPATQPIYQFMQEGSAEFGGEMLALTPNGAELLVATQVSGDKVIMKATTDRRTGSPPPFRRIGPVECQAAGDNEVCLVQSDLFVSGDGRKVYFLGGRQVGAAIISQLYELDTNLQSSPRAISNFTTEVLSLQMNRARTKVIWATQAERFRRNNAVFRADFNGQVLSNEQRIIDDPMGSIGFHYHEAVFLE